MKNYFHYANTVSCRNSSYFLSQIWNVYCHLNRWRHCRCDFKWRSIHLIMIVCVFSRTRVYVWRRDKIRVNQSNRLIFIFQIRSQRCFAYCVSTDIKSKFIITSKWWFCQSCHKCCYFFLDLNTDWQACLKKCFAFNF